MNKRVAFLLLPFFLVTLTAKANRCLWNPVFNRVDCCGNTAQAIWDPQFKKTVCPKSESGDSCIWHPQLNHTQCCDTFKHAVWNPRLFTLQCFN